MLEFCEDFIRVVAPDDLQPVPLNPPAHGLRSDGAGMFGEFFDIGRCGKAGLGLEPFLEPDGNIHHVHAIEGNFEPDGDVLDRLLRFSVDVENIKRLPDQRGQLRVPWPVRARRRRR